VHASAQEELATSEAATEEWEMDRDVVAQATQASPAETETAVFEEVFLEVTLAAAVPDRYASALAYAYDLRLAAPDVIRASS